MNPIKKLIYGLIKKNRHLSQEFYAKIYYEYYHGKKLNLENPVGYLEKLQWLKVFYHPKILHELVDKYEVRNYVEDKIGASYLNELYQVCEHYNEIDFQSLPDQYIIKGTHSSNMFVIVDEQHKINKTKLRLKIYKWRRKNLYYNGGQEWAYKHVKPRIIVEKLLEDKSGELVDFKLFSFRGKVKFIQVHKWFNGDKCIAHLDTEWNKLDVTSQGMKAYPGVIKRPENLDEMIMVASKLSDKLPFVRVDLYNVNGKIIFGELTFYPSDARKNFFPESFNKKVADYIILPEIPEGQKVISDLI